VKFTTSAIAALAQPANKADHIEWDPELPGFGVRLRGGAKRWIVQYRIGGRQRRESLGDVRRVELDAARKIARARFAQVELGVDPAADKASTRAAAAAAELSLARVAARYLDAKRDRLRPSTYQQAALHFATHWRPLRDRPLESIRRADVAARLGELIKQHGRIAAARARGNLSALFTWAMREGFCEVNPVVATNDPDAGVLPRERVLADNEIRTIWNAAGEDPAGCLVKLLLLTGCRRNEIGGLRWSEINLDTGLMTLAGVRTKNRRELALPLPAVALDLINAVPRREGRDYIFGRDGGAFLGWSVMKLRLDAKIVMMTGGKPLAHWTLHDCRRTVRTGLGRLGVPPHVAELCVNHAPRGIQAVYDKYRYGHEIGEALALWAEHVLAVAEGRASKIVPLRAR